jgi:hypothetical protein
VLEATADTGAVFDVSVKMDGKVIATQLDGRPIELDPGMHTFTFERPGSPAREEKTIIREGERSRLVSVSWATAQAPRGPDTAESVPMDRPVPLPVYVLAGVGVLGVADFVVFGLMGNNKKNELAGANGCAPFCTNDQVQSAKSLYLAGDIGLGVGIVALVVGGALYLTRPEQPRTGSAEPSGVAYNVVFAPSPSGGVVDLQGRF